MATSMAREGDVIVVTTSPIGWRDLVRGVLRGMLAGVVWGIAARAWMRLISPDPEFSWTGTLFILGIATVVGTLLGLAAVGRAGRHPRLARGLGAVAVLPLGIGAGVVMLPPILAGAFALPGPLPSRRTRVVLLGLPVTGLLVIGLEGRGLVWLGVGTATMVACGMWARTFRPAVSLLALGSLSLVVLPLFGGDLPWWRAMVGSVVYLLLLAPPAGAYARVVRDPLAPALPDPVDGRRRYTERLKGPR